MDCKHFLIWQEPLIRDHDLIAIPQKNKFLVIFLSSTAFSQRNEDLFSYLFYSDKTNKARIMGDENQKYIPAISWASTAVSLH